MMRMNRVAALVIVVSMTQGCPGRDTVSDEAPPPTRPAAVEEAEAEEVVRGAGEVRDAARRQGDQLRWELSAVDNLGRIGELTERQRSLLERQGFFLADQPEAPEGASAAEARTARRATHLFHVYERNDYIQMPSFVTADLAIDATLAYFEAVLRDVETHFLVPRLREALRELVDAAEAGRRAARSPEARAHAERALAFWAVALRLLAQPAPEDPPEVYVPEPPCPRDVCPEMWEEAATAGGAPADPTAVPRSVRAQVMGVVRQALAHEGEARTPIVRGTIDFSQLRPRGNYTRTGVLSRYFRAMSWLGMATFPLEGEDADVEGLALLARSYLAAPDAARTMDGVVGVTAFFAGGPDAATLRKAADALRAVKSDAGSAPPDALLAEDVLDPFRERVLQLPAPRITASAAGGGKQIRVAGRRAFEDTVAMQRLVGPIERMLVEERGPERALPVVAAGGSAAVMGSDLAREVIGEAAGAQHGAAVLSAVAQARSDIGALPDARYQADAYHGTLHAMLPLLGAPPEGAPPLLETDAWRRRSLYAYAGGWAKLRHATILYGAQLGAECDAPEYVPPPGYVEPVPEVYERLGAMARALAARLGEAGIDLEARPNEDDYYYTPLAGKTETLLRLLDFLRETAQAELEGRALDRETRQRLTLVGGEVEWLLISLANTDLLSQRDQDMAIVADVFTFRSAQRVVEVGLARPDLIYAIIPTSDGPVIARGAVMSYRELLHPMGDRLTDEQWRARLDRGEEPPIPSWVEPLYAEPVSAILLAEEAEGVDRCGPMTGAPMEI